MPKPKILLSDVEVDEVSLIDKGDNPRARFVLAKRKVGGAEKLYQAALDALEGAIGAVSEPLRKRLYADVRVDQAKDSAASELRKRIDALTEEFNEEFAGRFAEFVKDIEQPGTRGPDDKEDDMDLSKLSEKDRAEVEKALEAAKKTEGLEAKVAELEKGKKPDKKEPDDSELLKALPDNVRKLFEAEQAKNRAELEKRDGLIAALTDKSEREAFEKTLTVKRLPTTDEKLAELLFDIEVNKRDELVKLLKATDEQLVLAADITRVIGEGGDDDRAVTVKSKIDAKVAEIMKSDSKLTKEQAYDAALVANPHLYEELLAQTGPRH